MLYSALGLKLRSELAISVGAMPEEAGALIVDEHSCTTALGLYAAGVGFVALHQVVVARGHGAVAGTDIPNCGLTALI